MFLFTNIFFLILKSILIILPIFISAAFLTLFERKVMAAMQRRRGPNVLGFLGLLQPFSDALKLLMKENVIPTNANFFIFFLAPIVSLTLSILYWAIIPFYEGIVLIDLQLGILYIFVISSLSVYTIIMAGWSSNSKYAFLGSLRSVAQMISYEISISLNLMSILLISSSFNFFDIVNSQINIYNIWSFFPIFVMFFISVLAETNRPPFDLPEAENELVAGYFVEYSGVGFTLFYLAETINIVLMSALVSIFFFGGWLSPLFFYKSSFWLVLKILFFCFLFIWIRASLPRYRYDQLMFLGWKFFLPFSLSLFFFYFSLFYLLSAYIIFIQNV